MYDLGLSVAGNTQLNGKSPAFRAVQDSESAESFVRGRQGSNACVRRVTKDVYPGLARSNEAQRNGDPSINEVEKHSNTQPHRKRSEPP
jgi:hypothetical protein